MKSMELSSALGKCTVFIGESSENWIKKQSGENHVFSTDRNIFRLYRNIFAETPTIVIRTGEQEKKSSTIQQIYQQLMEFEADRTTVITGIGGGVVCDITGFAASTYMRGLRFNLVPTSLLAQVDASIGGKNGVNLRNYKNVIGTFAQPEHVLLDFSLLKTLSQKDVTSGTAEGTGYPENLGRKDMSLAKIREKIDLIDREILEKLNERMELALQTRKFKLQNSDRQRETQILEKIRKYSMRHPLIESDFAERIFSEFIKESNRLQDEEGK